MADDLKPLLDEGATLRDWDVEVTGGRNAVSEANAGIFKAVPDISIEVLDIHVCEPTSVCACEILVHLNNEAKDILKVTDIISSLSPLIDSSLASVHTKGNLGTADAVDVGKVLVLQFDWG